MILPHKVQMTMIEAISTVSIFWVVLGLLAVAFIFGSALLLVNSAEHTNQRFRLFQIARKRWSRRRRSNLD
jgi:hypothetical protein